MSSKIQKIITRLQGKITESQFYEAQQQTRVVGARFIKSKDWHAAIGILFSVAQSLLKAGQGGSGGDLSLMLVDVYNQAELKPDSGNKGQLLTLLRQFGSEEPTRKKFIGEMIGWSAKFGEYPAGEPDLHHVAGSLYAEERDVYEAESHLVLGTKESSEIYANMEYDWYNQDEPHTAATYAARAVLPYLLTGNVRDANRSLQVFTSRLRSENQNLVVQEVGNSSEIKIYPTLPLLNFLSLLLLAIQKGSPDVFRQLSNKYTAQINEIWQWNEALGLIGEMYFGIPRPRQGNPILDMFGGMFGGAAPAKPQTRRIGISEIPAADNLD